MAKHTLWQKVLQIFQEHSGETLEINQVRLLVNQQFEDNANNWQVYQAAASLKWRGYQVEKIKASKKLLPGKRTLRLSPVS